MTMVTILYARTVLKKTVAKTKADAAVESVEPV